MKMVKVKMEEAWLLLDKLGSAIEQAAFEVRQEEKKMSDGKKKAFENDITEAQSRGFSENLASAAKINGQIPKTDSHIPQPANARQVGGDHYKPGHLGGEQHWDRVQRLKLDYFQAQITKYVERCWLKNGVQDLEKAQHFLEKYLELKRRERLTHIENDGSEPTGAYVNQDGPKPTPVCCTCEVNSNAPNLVHFKHCNITRKK